MPKSIAQTRGEPTRARIIQAALASVRDRGFTASSARAIARTGGFNQALIHYHFGTIQDLMLAALRDFSERRLQRYRAALDGLTSVADIVETMTRLYQEDVEAGEVAAAQEIVAGSSSAPELRVGVTGLLEPWTAFAQEVVARLLRGTPFETVLPATEVAYALVALYFGVETLVHLDPDRTRTRALFAAGSRLAPLFDVQLRGGSHVG